MCGISGVFNLTSGQPVSSALLERMTRVLNHRGPDDQGMFLAGSVGLGHRRLSIIDLSEGHQPLLTEDGRSAIVFNGEIYNYQALREELIDRGHRFRTRSDTEVILQAYSAYGEACVERLRGMFAFAVWDGANNRLFVARDRVGIKPLYYYSDGRKFLFASEIKALLQDPSVPRDLNCLALDDYLTFGYVPAPKTIFQGIHKLLPGHTLTVTDQGVREREYWDLSFGSIDGPTDAERAEELLNTVRESVRMHLMSEVPLGAFLSGGVDSSAVVAIMAGLLDQPVTTASIGFGESGFDELAYARVVARHYHTNSRERVVEAEAVKILDDLTWFFDEPFADSSMIPTYYVCQVAREKVTVCLSGDGGDENFAGYRRYRFDALENRIRSAVPAAVRVSLFGALGRLYPKADWLPQVFRAKTLLTNLSLPAETAYFHSMSRFSPGMKALLYRDDVKRRVGDYHAFSVLAPYFDRSRGWDPLSRIQYVDIKTNLPDDILTKVDRASMAHSLEVRVPLLDHEVMEYAARIPPGSKLRGGEGKFIFKQALRGLIPSSILDRPKMGFSIPLAQWLRRDLRAMFEERVLANSAFVASLFDQKPIATWWSQHQRGTRDYSTHLWALLVLECWGRRFLAK
jgi:asparagine synthase (glutamine-hydrolysing)